MASAQKTQKLKEQFKKMDKNGDGCLDFAELKELLRQGNKSMSDMEIRTLYNAVDANGDGVVKFDEFIDYIYGSPSQSDSRTSAGRNARLRAAGAANDEGDPGKWDEITSIFDAFVGADCDGREFVKLCKDCGFMDRNFKPTDCDLIFAKVVPKGMRRMNYEMFQKAMMQVALNKKRPTAEIQDKIISAGGPQFQGTKADAVRFHDDKSTYTGAHTFNENHGSAGAGERDSESRRARHEHSRTGANTGPDGDWGELEGIFEAFVGQDCDGREFTKLCKDCGLYDRNFRATDADLVFSAVVPRGKRRMDFDMFQAAVRQIAGKKKTTTVDVQNAIISTGGPKFSGTKADAVRFHDDKSTYTGAHVYNEHHGNSPGPSRGQSPPGSPGLSPGGRERLGGERQARLAAQTASDDHGDDGLWADLESVFEAFVGRDCDGREFSKLCKDCKLYDRKYTATDADLVFSKVVPRGQRRMDYNMFKDAIGQVAKKKGCSTAMVQEAILSAGGPQFQGTQADSVRFHDDKSTYTGMHYGK